MFEKIRENFLDEYQGTGTLYRHKKTGMEVFHIKNESEELSCAFMFATPSQDDMGVAHILEHTVLSGSKRYDVKDPFDSVLQSSPNTFLNAITYTDKTVFPFASPLKKDFDILFGIYADAVFDALLRKESFEQQGIRFFDNKFDGVVFNEMRGASSSEDDFVSNYCMRSLFKGTPAMYISGGDPVSIADLTYEEFKNRYKQWYSPSNCRMFLYGNLDPQEYLNKLENLYLSDDHLAKWDNKKIIPSSDNYIKGEYKPVRDKVGCPVKDTNSVVMTWLTQPASDPLECLTINILVDILLGDPGAPLYKAAIDSDLGKDLNGMSGTDTDIPLLPFIYGFTDAQHAKEDEIEAFIMNELQNIVKNGLDSQRVQGAIKRQEFKLKEIKGGETPFGLTVAFRSAKNWLRGSDPEKGIVLRPVLEKIKELVSNGPYFESWIQKNLIDNPRRCLLTVYYDKNYEKNRKAVLAQKLKKRVDSYTKDELAAQKNKFDQFTDSKDSEEALACIDRIRVCDMPDKIPFFKQNSVKIGKATLLEFPLFTNGIVYCNFAFSTDGLSLEEKKLLPLLTRLIEIESTQDHDYVQIGILTKLLMGGFSVSLSNGTDSLGKEKSYVYIKSKMLFQDLEKALDLISEILLKGKLSDTERIKAALSDICTDFESDYLYSGHRFAVLKAGAQVSSSMYETELTSGTSSYLYMKSLEDSKDNFKSLSVQLTNLRDKVFSQGVMTVQIAAGQEHIKECITAVSKMIYRIPENDIVSNTNKSSVIADEIVKEQYLQVSSGPAYNALVTPLSKFSESQLVAGLLYSSALGNGRLWEIVRGKNGAYGVFSTVNLQDKLFYCASYRDPNVYKTFDAFIEALDCSISKEEMEYVIVNVIGKELKPLSPQGKALEAFRRYLFSTTDELYLKRRETMLSLTIEDVEQARKEIKKAVSELNSRATVCGKDLIPDAKSKNITRVGL